MDLDPDLPVELANIGLRLGLNEPHTQRDLFARLALADALCTPCPRTLRPPLIASVVTGFSAFLPRCCIQWLALLLAFGFSVAFAEDRACLHVVGPKPFARLLMKCVAALQGMLGISNVKVWNPCRTCGLRRKWSPASTPAPLAPVRHRTRPRTPLPPPRPQRQSFRQSQGLLCHESKGAPNRPGLAFEPSPGIAGAARHVGERRHRASVAHRLRHGPAKSGGRAPRGQQEVDRGKPLGSGLRSGAGSLQSIRVRTHGRAGGSSERHVGAIGADRRGRPARPARPYSMHTDGVPASNSGPGAPISRSEECPRATTSPLRAAPGPAALTPPSGDAWGRSWPPAGAQAHSDPPRGAIARGARHRALAAGQQAQAGADQGALARDAIVGARLHVAHAS